MMAEIPKFNENSGYFGIADFGRADFGRCQKNCCHVSLLISRASILGSRFLSKSYLRHKSKALLTEWLPCCQDGKLNS
jgi:hypothetical protein